MRTEKVMTPHVLAVAANIIVDLALLAADDDLELLLELVVFNRIDSISRWREQLGALLFYLGYRVDLVLVLVLDEQVVAVHELEEHLFEGPAREYLV